MHVSIIVPVYNVAKILRPCLESLAAQTYKDIDVIFVDDCGQDDSLIILNDYLKNNFFPQHQIISHKVNKGLSAARNTGLQASRGEYVYFLDSDDEISHDCIERLIAPCNETEYDVVIGSYEELYADGTSQKNILKSGDVIEPLKEYADGNWYVMAWNKLCKKSFIVDNHLFFEEGLLHEDVVWSFKLACSCKSMFTVHDITYFYKIRSKSIMTSLPVEKDAAIYVRAFETIHDFIKESDLCNDPDVYRMVEGKKNGILYSLLQINRKDVFKQIYPSIHRIVTISPMKAFINRQIGLGYLIRDLNYCLPEKLGMIHKKTFYLLVYKVRRRRIKGAIWNQ